MEDLLSRLCERMVRRRNFIWEPGSAWIEYAHKEHERVPFRAILAIFEGSSSAVIASLTPLRAPDPAGTSSPWVHA